MTDGVLEDLVQAEFNARKKVYQKSEFADQNKRHANATLAGAPFFTRLFKSALQFRLPSPEMASGKSGASGLASSVTK